MVLPQEGGAGAPQQGISLRFTLFYCDAAIEPIHQLFADVATSSVWRYGRGLQLQPELPSSTKILL